MKLKEKWKLIIVTENVNVNDLMCFNKTLKNLVMNVFKSNLMLQLLFNMFYNKCFKCEIEIQMSENVKWNK